MTTTELVNKINNALVTKQLIIPDGKKIAIITNATYSNGKLEARAAVGFKINNEWHFGIVTDWSHDTGISEGLVLEYSK